MPLSKTLRALWIWGPLAAYVVLIFYLSSLSAIPWASGTPDYISHAVEYCGLAILVARALNGGLDRPVPPRRLATAFLLTIGCAGLDETWQYFTPNRFADFRDVISDAAGSAIGLGTLHLTRGFLARARVL
jgi:VanZ family protein